jgi:hypothetical protein
MSSTSKPESAVGSLTLKDEGVAQSFPFFDLLINQFSTQQTDVRITKVDSNL